MHNDSGGIRPVPAFSPSKRIVGLLVYTISALVIVVIGVVALGVIGRDLDFAISVLGSLVGGFLGALLAMTLILGLLQPDRSEAEAARDPGPTGGGVAEAE
jgi:hypothetical protein